MVDMGMTRTLVSDPWKTDKGSSMPQSPSLGEVQNMAKLSIPLEYEGC